MPAARAAAGGEGDNKQLKKNATTNNKRRWLPPPPRVWAFVYLLQDGTVSSFYLSSSVQHISNMHFLSYMNEMNLSMNHVLNYAAN